MIFCPFTCAIVNNLAQPDITFLFFSRVFTRLSGFINVEYKLLSGNMLPCCTLYCQAVAFATANFSNHLATSDVGLMVCSTTVENRFSILAAALSNSMNLTMMSPCSPISTAWNAWFAPHFVPSLVSRTVPSLAASLVENSTLSIRLFTALHTAGYCTPCSRMNAITVADLTLNANFNVAIIIPFPCLAKDQVKIHFTCIESLALWRIATKQPVFNLVANSDSSSFPLASELLVFRSNGYDIPALEHANSAGDYWFVCSSLRGYSRQPSWQPFR